MPKIPLIRISRHPYLAVFAGAFLVSLLASLSIERLLIAPFVPGQVGGLLGPTGDWVVYHGDGVRLARTLGWRALALAIPEERFLAVNAMAYKLFGATPSALLPLFAALHATGAVALFFVARALLGAGRSALLCLLPYLFFPTSLFLFTHPLKDAYFVPGFFVLLAAQFELLAGESLQGEDRRALKTGVAAAGAFVVSIFLLYLSREYMLYLVSLTLYLPASRFLFEAIRNALAGRAATAAMATALAALFLGCALLSDALTRDYQKAAFVEPLPAVSSENPAGDPVASGSLGPGMAVAPHAEEPPRTDAFWNPSAVLPPVVDRLFRAIAGVRTGFTTTSPGAPTAIDTQVVFRSATDVVSYLPRAVQIAFLAPFPSAWFGSGSERIGRLMRRVTGFEMLIVYLCLLGLPGLLRERKTAVAWTALVCAAFSVLYGLVIANVGTLYRLRYAMLLYLAFLGLCGHLRSGQSWRNFSLKRVSNAKSRS